jgi:phage virion morphogenesis protein
MSVTIQIDEISPKLDHLIRQAKDTRPILRAMGTEFLSITQRAFDNPSLRIAEWVARKNTKFAPHPSKSGRQRLVTSDGGSTHPLLKKSGLMVKSFRVEVGTSTVTIASDRPYARIHQFGGMTGKGHKTKIPARPFMPITRDGTMPEWAQTKIVKVAEAAAKLQLGI